MITVIHGNDTALSRKYFLDLKEKAKDSVLIDGAKVSITDVTQYVEGGGLFSEPKNFFIEQLLSKRKKSKELDVVISYLRTAATENDIFLWEEKEISPAMLKSLGNPSVKVFKLPQTLFLFLDNLRPGNSKALLQLFHDTIATTDPEMVFFMLVRQMRVLLAVKEAGDEPIEELKRMTWQLGKLKSQAALFEKEELIQLYQQLYEIEKGLKTGTLPVNVVQAIDLWLLEI